MDTPLARQLITIRSSRLVDGSDEVHKMRIAQKAIAASRDHGPGRSRPPAARPPCPLVAAHLRHDSPLCGSSARVWQTAPLVDLPEPRDVAELLALEPHGPDTYIGAVPRYEWGRIYGGQVIAQGLQAAARTVPDDRPVHSLHAYFILGGRLDEPVRYEVDRVRNGSSFMTRRVVARQSYGAILTLEASFQRPEPAPDVQTVTMPEGVPGPEELAEAGWGWMLERRPAPHRHGSARVHTWVRVDPSLGDDPVQQACGLALASDTSTVNAVRSAHPAGDIRPDDYREVFMGASLDHAVWFHRPARADRWMLIDMTCHSVMGARGLSFGHVFDEDGRHVATIAQEALLRERRRDTDPAGDISRT